MKRGKNKSKNRKDFKENVKGITLIALVVTIIVLLILAGVAITLTVGQDGIFSRAQDVVVRNENASVYEQLQFVVLDYQMDATETGNGFELLDKLKKDGYIDNKNVVNVKKLMNISMQTGKGDIDTGDVYVIEERVRTASSVLSDTSVTTNYCLCLIYYDENNGETNLGPIGEAEPKNYVELEYEFDDENNTAVCIGPKKLDDFYAPGYGDKYAEGEWIINIPEAVNGHSVVGIDFSNIDATTEWGENIVGINIPKTVININFARLSFINIDTVNVDSENPVYFVEDNIMYSQDNNGNRGVIRILGKKIRSENIIVIPNGVKYIDEWILYSLKMDYYYATILVYEKGPEPLPESAKGLDIIDLNEENLHYQGDEIVIEDGCIYSKNKEVLISVNRKIDKYIVPAEVKYWTDTSFYYTNLRELDLSNFLGDPVKYYSYVSIEYCNIGNIIFPTELSDNILFYDSNIENVEISENINESIYFQNCNIKNLKYEEGLENISLVIQEGKVDTIEIPSTATSIENLLKEEEGYTSPQINEIIINKPEGSISLDDLGLENVKITWKG